MTEQEKEKHLDIIDKLSLDRKFNAAFDYINENVSPLFEPKEFGDFKQLVKDNAIKFGIVLN